MSSTPTEPKDELYLERRYESFMKRIEKVNGCWEWQGFLDNGYGSASFKGKIMGAHRVSLLLAGHNLVEGLDVDHLCRNRRCVNPEHLEQVTRKENVARGVSSEAMKARNAERTHCKNGHEYGKRNYRIVTNKQGEKRRYYKTCLVCDLNYHLRGARNADAPSGETATRYVAATEVNAKFLYYLAERGLVSPEPKEWFRCLKRIHTALTNQTTEGEP